jgi:Protein kinase domain/PDZ domain/BON domain
LAGVIKCPNCSFANLDGSAYCDSCGDALGGTAALSGTAALGAAAGPAPSAGRVVAGRYRIERELGGGGQKQMFLAADLRLSQRLCALAELTPSARTQEAIAEGKAMFQREAEILATLSNIHIVQVYDYFDEHDRCYLVEEYVRGRSLQDRIAGRGSLAVGEIVPLVMQVLDALEYIHSLTPPLVHRDLKPDNIMLAPATGNAEVVKLIDFGIARHFQIQRGTVHGTPGYAAPEQYRGLSDPRTDLYALGAILHYALSGRDPQEQPPFSFPPLASVRSDLPRPLCELVDQALSLEPEHRVPTAGGFKVRLLAATSGYQHPAPTSVVHRAPATQPHAQAPQPRAPTGPRMPAPQPHAAAPAEVPAPADIEWSPAEVAFRGVRHGGPVEPVMLTVRNNGRGTLEARVDTDSPEMVHVAPDRIGQNQAQLQVRIDSSAVIWGHRYRAKVRLTMDHSQATVAIPVMVEAADNQTVLTRVRSLSTAALVIAPLITLAIEILLAGAGINISRNLHGATFTAIRESADVISIVALIGVLIALVAVSRRSRGLLLLIGIIGILALHNSVAAILVDYLMLPVFVAAAAKGGGLAFRRVCIRIVAREGMGLWPQMRAFFLLMAVPSAVLLGTTAWLLTAATPGPALASRPWVPPPPPVYAPPTAVPVPPPVTAPPRVAARPPVSARPPMPLPPAIEYHAPARPRSTPPPPELVEAEINRRLAANGFSDITARVAGGGRAYLQGDAKDINQVREIENIARSVPGVRSLAPRISVPKGWMGVTVNSSRRGAMVQYLMPGGPAARAGIALGDVIVAIDGVPIRNHADFHSAISTKAAGQNVSVTFLRGTQSMNVTVSLRKSPFRHG